MKTEITIKFAGITVEPDSCVLGFDTAKELLYSVANGKVDDLTLRIGDVLFDYETGTKWEVVKRVDEK